MRRALVSAALALSLSGCAGGGPAPVAASQRAAEGAAGVTTLALRSWPPEGRPCAVILALHGFGDTAELAFDDAARYWADRGIAVYAPDQRGFGANPSRRRWPGAETLADDAVTLARDLRARHPDAPLVVVGHSMGGGVALAAADRGLDADALVLAGPAIAGGAALNPALRAGAWTLAAILPDRRWTGRGVVRIRPTDNPAALAAARADPRHFGDPSSRELWGLVRVMDRAAAAAPRVETPTLTLMGERDEVLRPERVRSVHEAIPGARGYLSYPDGWHWLFRDRQAPRVWADVADFVLAVEPTADGRAR
jgi:alpha-beta hydrolase superfamily lysophospholipase